MGKRTLKSSFSTVEKVRMDSAVEEAIRQTYKQAAHRVGTRAFLYGLGFGIILTVGIALIAYQF